MAEGSHEGATACQNILRISWNCFDLVLRMLLESGIWNLGDGIRIWASSFGFRRHHHCPRSVTGQS